MVNLLTKLRPDISFHRNGIIRLTAKVVRLLNLCPGDFINIAAIESEYLLHASHRAQEIDSEALGARCYPSKRGENNFCANSARLCRSLFSVIGVNAHKVSFKVGTPMAINGTTYLPIITRRPL